MRGLLILFLWSLAFCSSGQGSSAENWKILSKLEYEKSTDEYGEIYVPKFGAEIKALEGKEITLSGYIIAHHETIPKQNEHLIIDDYAFDILWVSDTRIESVKMRILKY